MRKYILGISLLLLAGLFLYDFTILHNRPEKKEAEQQAQTEAEEATTQWIQAEMLETEVQDETEQQVLADKGTQQIGVEEIETQRLSPDKIQVRWNSALDAAVDKYIVKKRSVFNKESVGDWETVAVVESGLAEYMVVDILDSSAPVQYEYRVDVKVTDDSAYDPAEGKSVLASNVMVCIDPGHYAGKNAVTGSDSYGYVEGDFTLAIAVQLRDILKETYGIDSYMTRESGSITLDGYTDITLDQKHISLRGEYAALQQSNLIVSIHTNANNDNANGYGTWEQPVALNKTLIFVNLVGKKSDMALGICNAIGVNLSKTNYELGLSSMRDFRTVDDASDIREWTDTYNDSLNEPGTVVCRMNDDMDYYGVLRGAASAGIPGIIIEHGMHTVPQIREAAQGGLAEYWAEADAYGIAYGFGFMKDITMK